MIDATGQFADGALRSLPAANGVNTREAQASRNQAASTRGVSKDAGALAALLLAATLLGGAAIVRRPDLVANAAFLFGDQGLNLFIADRLLAGERLFLEVFTPYGPLPAYLHTAFVSLTGNTIVAYNVLLLLLTLVNVVLAYVLVRSRTSAGVAMLVVGVGVFPSFLIPGSLVGSFTVSPYIPLERALLLGAALAWTPPQSRSAGRAVLIGTLLGLWQWVKFGGAVFAGAAIIVLDLVLIWKSPNRSAALRRWFQGLGLALAVFAAFEVCRIVGAFLLLPSDIARDVVWPAYHLATYEGWVNAELRWLTWGGWRLFIAQYLSPAVAVALIGGVLLWSASRSEEDGLLTAADLRLLLPALFVAIGLLGYLQQAHIMRQFLWAVVIGSSIALLRSGPVLRGVVLLLWLPGLLVAGRAMLVTSPPSHLVAMELPGAGTISVHPVLEESLEAVLHTVDQFRRDRAEVGDVPYEEVPALFMRMAAGVHAVYNVPAPIRQPWIIPGFVRPYDEAALIEAAERLAAIVVVGGTIGEGSPHSACAWFEPAPIRGELCAVLDPLLGAPVRIGSEFAVFPVLASE